VESCVIKEQRTTLHIDGAETPKSPVPSTLKLSDVPATFHCQMFVIVDINTWSWPLESCSFSNSITYYRSVSSKKIMMSSCLIKRHNMKVYGGV
jgi:hypothetical protein